MTGFPETLMLGQILTRELTKEIERRYNTYAELERQLAKSNRKNEYEQLCSSELEQQLNVAKAEAAHVKKVEFPRKVAVVAENWRKKLDAKDVLAMRQQLASAQERIEGVKVQRDVERSAYLNEFEKNQVLVAELTSLSKCRNATVNAGPSCNF